MAWPVMMHYGFGYGYGFGYRALPWVGIGIGALLLKTLVAGAVLLFVVELLHRNRPSRVEAMAGAYGPLQIVRERYARGEIDKEQFEQMSRDLQGR